MSQLSSIIKSALVDLYGTQRAMPVGHVKGQASQLPELIHRIKALNQRLRRWYDNLTPKLKLKDMGDHNLKETSEQRSFEEHLFHLQALILKLAYENTKILIHRLLLSFKAVTRSNYSPRQPTSHNSDPFASAIHICRDSALQISLLGAAPSVKQAADTYALSFMCLHLFTAAVTLCIVCSIDPLSQDAHNCKIGIRRLMETQNQLKHKSVVASQGLDITRRLMSLVLTKEIDATFNISSPVEVNTTVRAKGPKVVSGPSEGIQPLSPGLPIVTPVMPSPGQFMTTGDIYAAPNTNATVEVAESGMIDPGYSGIDYCENSLINEAFVDFGQGETHVATGCVGPLTD